MNRFLITSIAALAFGAMASAQAVFSAGTLTITQPNTDDAFTVEVGPAAGLTRIFTATGIPDGLTFRGVTRLVIRTNGGADKVYVKVEAPVAPAIDIETGIGESEVDIALKTSALGSAASSIRVVGGDQNDKTSITLDSLATNVLSLNWSVDARGGLNETAAYVISDNRTNQTNMVYSVLGGSDFDSVLLDMSSKAASMAVSLRGSLGASMDKLEIRAKGDTLTNSTFTSNFDLGAGMDEASIDFSDVISTTYNGALNTGTEMDQLSASFGGDLAGTGAFITGDGNDVAKFFAGRFTSAVRVFMGAGSDLTEFNTVRPSLVLPYADGGLGIDHLKGRATSVGYEIFN